MTILLIRHGETAHNAARVLQTADAELSERGSAQARLLAQRLAGEGIDHILASDLRRAAATAECLAAATGAAIELEPLLQERNFGELRGRAYAELGADPFAADFAPPGGETWAAFHSRVDRAWARVAEVHARRGGRLAVVTHGLVCYALAERVLALPAGARASLGIPNTALTVVDPAPPWRVRLLNCTSHLDPAVAQAEVPRAGP